MIHQATGISKSTLYSTIVEFDRQNRLHPHKNLTGYSRGGITLYNHIILTDNYDTPQGRTLQESNGYVGQWFDIIPHELGHRVQSDRMTLYLTTYVGQSIWTGIKKLFSSGSVDKDIVHDEIVMEQEASQYQDKFDDFLKFFDYRDKRGRR